MSINWIDIIIFFVLIMSVYWGWKGGITGEMFCFLGIVLALFFAFRLTHPLADWFDEFLAVPLSVLRIACFVGISALVYFGVQMVKMSIQKMGETLPVYDSIERFGGAGIGFVKGSLLVFLVLLVLMSMPMEPVHQQIKQRTVLARQMILVMPGIYGYMTESWRGPKVLSFKNYLTKVADQIEEKNLKHKRL